MGYVKSYASAKDATQIIDTMSLIQLQSLKASLDVERLTSATLGRKCNQKLLAHVERKLKDKGVI